MAKSSGKFKILYGECEPDVMASQAAEIEKAGYDVQQAAGRSGVERALHQGGFDLVVLGPTLTKNDRHHLPYMVKKLRRTPRCWSCTPMANAIPPSTPTSTPAKICSTF